MALYGGQGLGIEEMVRGGGGERARKVAGEWHSDVDSTSKSHIEG